MPVKAKAAAKATARTHPTIAGLQAEVARLTEELAAVNRDNSRVHNQRDAAWAHLGRLWEATGGEQGDRRAETREELLGWGVDDAITLITSLREQVDGLQSQATWLFDRLAQHERERAACWGCRISAYWRSLRG